jgi:hypothetical protein
MAQRGASGNPFYLSLSSRSTVAQKKKCCRHWLTADFIFEMSDVYIDLGIEFNPFIQPDIAAVNVGWNTLGVNSYA